MRERSRKVASKGISALIVGTLLAVMNEPLSETMFSEQAIKDAVFVLQFLGSSLMTYATLLVLKGNKNV